MKELERSDFQKIWWIAKGDVAKATGEVADALAASRDVRGRTVIFVPPAGAPLMVVDREGVYVVGLIRAKVFLSPQVGADQIFCVFGPRSRPLACSGPMASAEVGAINEARGSSVSGQVDHVETDRVTNFWSVFMDGQFRTSDWTVAISGPTQAATKPLLQLRRLLGLVAALAIALGCLVSVVQIRRYLVPLVQLREATKAVAAQRFDAALTVTSGDEFQELAESFNTMSTKLQSQFRMLEALAEIDRLVLSSLDADYIVETLISRLGELYPCETICVIRYVGNSQLRITSFRRGTDAHDDAVTEASAEQRVLVSSFDTPSVVCMDTCPQLLKLVPVPLEQCLVVFPVGQSETRSVLCMSHREEPDLNSDEVRQIADLVNRASVAMSNAAWEEKLYHQAHYDKLTGLPNRVLLRDRVEQATARARRDGGQVALFVIDLDRFKAVNDSLGHQAGDELLCAIASRLENVECDSVVRFGGDEFVAVASGLAAGAAGLKAAEVIAQEFTDAISQPVVVRGRELVSTASLGLAMFPGDGESLDTLLSRADAAMYYAKSTGRARYQVFASELRIESTELDMELDLRDGIKRGELFVLYQPKVTRADGHIMGAEALVRWEHPQRGLVSPGEFIAMAESTGLVIPLGEWVLHQACVDAYRLHQRGVEMKIAVNLSPLQFAQNNIVEVIADALKRSKLPPHLLELEVTEGMFVTNVEGAIATLHGLSNLGVSISIDDFGTGYSSLAYLAQFPIDTIKVDQSFVRQMLDEPKVQRVVSAIVTLGRSLGLQIVAEGVETPAQRDALAALGCDYFQGYLFSRPIPFDEFEELIETSDVQVRRAS